MTQAGTPSLLTDREVAATLLEQHWQRIAYCHRCGCWRPRSDFRPPRRVCRVCRPCRTAEQALSLYGLRWGA